MSRTGVAHLPLHGGKAPRWLFKRMVLLSEEITEVLVLEYGTDEFLRRLSDPFWFQALSCVLGYDWHSSGTTTVTCGALKEALNHKNIGIVIAGGKGKTSRNTLTEIEQYAEQYNFSSSMIQELQYASRMAAKVDNTAIQDGYDLYHHVLVFSENKHWAVVQQGLNNDTSYARRYHWCSENLENFVCEPHDAIIGDDTQRHVLDMTAKQSTNTQKVSVDLVNDNPRHLIRNWAELTRHQHQQTLDDWRKPLENKRKLVHLDMPRTINWNKMREIYDVHPTTYEGLLSLRGVGPNTVRALALISELIYGEEPSWKDPIRWSFALGGKDNVPRPVDLPAYKNSIETLREAVKQAKIGDHEKLEALKRLRHVTPPIPVNPSVLT